jgi:polygalacturonase
MGTSGISLETVDGGVMQGIVITNVQIEGTESPIFIRLGNRARPYQKNMEINHTGELGDIAIDQVQIRNAGNTGCSITGLPGFPVSNIRLSNIFYCQEGGGTVADIHNKVPEKPKDYPEATMFGTLPAYGFYIRHARNISFSNIELASQKDDQRPALYLDDVEYGNFSNMQIQSNNNNEANIWLNQTRNIIIQGSSLKGNSNCFVKIEGEKNSHISIFNNTLDGVINAVSVSENSKDQIKESGNMQ